MGSIRRSCRNAVAVAEAGRKGDQLPRRRLARVDPGRDRRPPRSRISASSSPADGISVARALRAIHRRQRQARQHNQNRQRPGAACAGRGGMGISPSAAGRIRRSRAQVAAAPPVAREIAWKAQVRLCKRFRMLSRKGNEIDCGGNRDCARAHCLHLGHRPRGARRESDTRGMSRPSSLDPSNRDRARRSHGQLVAEHSAAAGGEAMAGEPSQTHYVADQ